MSLFDSIQMENVKAYKTSRALYTVEDILTSTKKYMQVTPKSYHLVSRKGDNWRRKDQYQSKADMRSICLKISNSF